MAGQDEKAEPAAHAPQEERAAGAEAEAKAPRAAAKLVFKDPLSQQTTDDTDAGWGDSSAGRGLDWYQSQRPPHHGD